MENLSHLILASTSKSPPPTSPYPPPASSYPPSASPYHGLNSPMSTPLQDIGQTTTLPFTTNTSFASNTSSLSSLSSDTYLASNIASLASNVSNASFDTFSLASNVSNTSVASNNTIPGHGPIAIAILSTCLVISMVLALVGNMMVILTIARHRGMRTRTNVLLANLALADILVAVLDMPIALVTIISKDWIFSKALCYANGFFVGMGLMLSVHTLMWISIHKFVSITRPFSRPVTPRKIVMMILAAWTWAIFFNLTPIMGLTTTDFKAGASQCGPPPPKEMKQYIHAALNTSINLVIPCIVMVYCYYKIFKEVKDHLSRMQEFTDFSVRNSLIQQKQITETLCIVLSVFILCWMPYIIYSMSLVFLGKKVVPEIFNPIAYLFGYMNSACNPIIYALRSPSFRLGFTEIICRNSHYNPGGSKSRVAKRPVGRMVTSIRQSIWRSPRKNAPPAPVKLQKRFGSQSNVDQDHVQHGRNKEVSTVHAVGSSLPVGKYRHAQPIPSVEVSEHETSKMYDAEKSQELVESNKYSLHNSSDFELNSKAVPGSVSNVSLDCSKNEEIGETEDNDLLNTEKGENKSMTGYTETHFASGSWGSLGSLDQGESGEGRKRCSSNVILGGKHKMKKFESRSQDSVQLLSFQNLHHQTASKKLSHSNHEIIMTTVGIMSDQIRSVSACDVRPLKTSTINNECNISPPKVPRDVKKPLLWRQASVENVSVSSSSSSIHLGVSNLITNVKRSITDLLFADVKSYAQGETKEDNMGFENIETKL